MQFGYGLECALDSRAHSKGYYWTGTLGNCRYAHLRFCLLLEVVLAHRFLCFLTFGGGTNFGGADGFACANIATSILSAAMRSPFGGENGAVGDDVVSAWTISAAAIAAASALVTLGIVQLCGKNSTVRAIRSLRVFVM